MKVKRFYGSSLRSVLRQVSEEFGNDAAILSNNKVEGGVEVIAAINYDDSLIPSESTEEVAVANPSNNISAQAKKSDKINSSMENNHQQVSNFDDSSSTNNSVNLENTTQEFSAFKRDSNPPKKKFEWSLDPSLQAMKEELGLMRSMMSEQLKGIGWNQFADSSPISAMILRRLTELGLEGDFVQSLLPHIDQSMDAECAWQNILAILAKSLPVIADDIVDRGGIFAFMGPAGVGKTTTIAKLAAKHVISHGANSVVLITTDNYRISGQEQLAAFGRILQVPCYKVSESQPLKSLLNRYANKRLVLIDTAGMSRSDTHLVGQLEAINRSPKPIHKFLLMSAASQAAVLRQSLNLFNTYSPDSVIITKLDEAASLGEVLSVVTKTNMPVAYTTDGQNIPEDIRVALCHQLVSKSVWLANKYHKTLDDWRLAQTIEPAKSA